jgi:hypothetical protein
MSRTIKNEQLYTQEEHNMFINPSPKRTTLSQQIDAKNERDLELGEGRVRADLNS